MEAGTDRAVPTTSDPARRGWYPDPNDGEMARWWDGSQWTAAVRSPDPDLARPRATVSRWAYAGVAATVAGSLAVILLF